MLSNLISRTVATLPRLSRRPIFTTPDIHHMTLGRLEEFTEKVSRRKGKSYEGKTEDGVPHGYGTYLAEFSNGTKIISQGTWDKGLISYGSIAIKDPDDQEISKYEGNFMDGNKDGYGKYSEGGNLRYEGSWSQDHLVGNAKIYDNSGELIHVGTTYKGSFPVENSKLYSIHGNIWPDGFVKLINDKFYPNQKLLLKDTNDPGSIAEQINQMDSDSLALFPINIPGHVFLLSVYKDKEGGVSLTYIDNLKDSQNASSDFNTLLISGTTSLISDITDMRGIDAINNKTNSGYCTFNTMLIMHSLSSKWLDREKDKEFNYNHFVKDIVSNMTSNDSKELISLEYLSLLKPVFIGLPVIQYTNPAGGREAEIAIDMKDGTLLTTSVEGGEIDEDRIKYLIRGKDSKAGFRFFMDVAGESFPINPFEGVVEISKDQKTPDEMLDNLKSELKKGPVLSLGNVMDDIKQIQKRFPDTAKLNQLLGDHTASSTIAKPLAKQISRNQESRER